MSDPFVLVHGSATGAWFWKWVCNGLRSRGHDVLTPDLLGYGAAPAPPATGYDFGHEAEHLSTWLAPHSVDRFHLVAHSMGASIALRWRLSLPASQVASVTLVDPLVVGLLAAHDAEADAETRAAYEVFRDVWPDREAAARAFTTFWNGDDAWARLGQRARTLLISLADKVRLELEAAAAWQPDPDELGVDAPPTEILVGGNTRGGPRVTSAVLRVALGANLEVVDGAGHAIPLTHPESVVDACERAAARAAMGR